MSERCGTSAFSSKIELFTSLKLHDWPALTLAIQNDWGGEASHDKRDWLAGAVSDLLAARQVADAEDLEEVLIQVMLDEFGVVVDDDSPAEVAAGIVKGRQRLLEGDYTELDQMLIRWEEKQTMGPPKLAFEKAEAPKEGGDISWESSSDGEDDAEMNEAPQLVSAPRTQKREPEVDDEGFTKVVGKKKR